MGKANSEITSIALLNQTQGQQHFFQINLPADTANIEGVETAIRILGSDVQIINNKHQAVGMLWLHSVGKPGLCYHAQVDLDQKEMISTDLGFLYRQAGFPIDTILNRDAIAQGASWEPEKILLPGAKMIYGQYRDLIGPSHGGQIIYQLSIHLWRTVKTLPKN